MAQLCQEEWYPVAGWEGKYWVSSFGRVKGRVKELKQWKGNNGYCTVALEEGSKKDGSRVSKFASVHRLVAKAFIPNPNEYPQVNHIDEDKTNNRVDNLEWCTAKYNMNYGEAPKTRVSKIDFSAPVYKEFGQRVKPMFSLPVAQLTMSGKFIKEYPSDMEASRQTGIDRAHINAAANNKRKSAGGYKWIRQRKDKK